MMNRSSGLNAAFKYKFFMVIWVMLTAVAIYVQDQQLERKIASRWHVYLMAEAVTYFPLKFLTNEAYIKVGGQNVSASYVANYLGKKEYIQQLNKRFFIYTPLATFLVTLVLALAIRDKKKHTHPNSKRVLEEWVED